MSKSLCVLLTVACIIWTIGCATTEPGVNVVGKPQTVKMTLRNSEDAAQEIGFGNCQWLVPLDAPPKALSQQPTLLSKKPVFFAAKYGDAKDNVYTFILDEGGGAGTGYDTLYYDADNDGRIDPERDRIKVIVDAGNSRISESSNVRLKLMVRAGGQTVPYWVSFCAFPYKDEKYPNQYIHATARDSSYYVGEALLDGKRCKIAIADLNGNGLFNDPEKDLFEGDRFFADLTGKGDFTHADDPNLMKSFPYGKYTKIGDRWYVVRAKPSGTQVTVTEARPPLGRIAVNKNLSHIMLRSEEQSLYLDLVNGEAEAVSGTYRPTEVWLKAAVGADPRRGRFGDKPPFVTVKQSETTAFAAGPPLQLEVSPEVMADAHCIGLDLVIKGCGGETYRAPHRNAQDPLAPRFEVRDSAGKVVSSGAFEYG